MTTKSTVHALCSMALLATAGAAEDRVFEDQVRPILESNCLPCHTAKTRSGGFSIDAVAGVVTPGKPEQSRLIQLLTAKAAPRMPLGKPALPAEQVETIAKWIRAMPD